jgi:hypothetical protein
VKPAPPAPATLAGIKSAVDDWFERGDSNPNNLLVFYFCGHGLGNETQMSLLPQDFGAVKGEAFATAVNFHGFKRGMRACRALNQAFFVDACRSDSDLLSDDNVGRSLRDAVPPPAKLRQPVYWSTRLGENSQALKNQPSHFTTALIEGLGGLGADNPAGPWRVSTNRLSEAISLRMEAVMRRANEDQLSPADELTPFILNTLATDPVVPIQIICTPPEALAKVSLSCARGGEVLHTVKAPSPAAWELRLPAVRESYSVGAKLAKDALFKDALASVNVRPPGFPVPLILSKKKKNGT